MSLLAAPMMGIGTMASSAPKIETADYVTNKVYENGTLKRILIDGGYIEGGTYHFYAANHLGNNHIVADASGAVIQMNHYYPFGTAFAETSKEDQDKQPYKYNGKELDQKLGLKLYDYSARHKWDFGLTTLDPLAETDYNWSPYVYVDNNPLRFIDPDGMKKGDPDDPYELSEVIVTPQPIKKGDQVLPAESAFWNIWYFFAGGGREFTPTYAPAPENKYPQLYASNTFTVGTDGKVDDLKMNIITGIAPTPGIKGGSIKGIKGLIGTARSNLLNKVINPKLKNVVNDLYRPGAQIGSGSSMDAFRLEVLSGVAVNGKTHGTKLIMYRTALQKLWDKKSSLTKEEQVIVKQLLTDIQDALSGF
ncbi:MAG: RHS repeat-associated core domain-containing protein [Dysgonomonas sp.]|nr:RHS repeat-associated core domain-containing protein [Dysgonomonas sp.]